MFQFWRRLADQMTHHQVGRTVVDLLLFRQRTYYALSRQDAVRWVGLVTYRT